MASLKKKSLGDDNPAMPGGTGDPEDPGDAPPPENPGDSVPQQYSGAFMQFLKTVASYTGDLSALTCPAFLLSSTSLTEYSAYWADHPELLAAISRGTTAEDRMAAVLRWFISTLYGSYYSRCAKGYEKKPYNPILGEQFFCKFPTVDDSGETRLVCEQVSHHPPITGFYIENATAGVYLNGHCGQKSSFKGTSIKVEQTGRVILRTANNSEIYIITYPDIYIRSLYTGSPFLELTGDCSVRSSAGLTTRITFVPKPWFSGTYHQFNASVHRNDDPSKPIFTATGRWMAKSTITNTATGTGEILFDAEASPISERVVEPLEKQNPLESRRLWAKVTKGIETGNYSAATEEKKAIEESQRAEKRERHAKGEEWTPKLFHFVKDKGAPEDDGGFLTAEAGRATGSGSAANQKDKKRSKKSSAAASPASEEDSDVEFSDLPPGEGGSWVYNESLHTSG